MIKAAHYYTKQGFSVIPIGDNKRAVFPWTEFQSRIISTEEINAQFNNDRAKNIAIIGGGVSGGLEIIDVDLKYDVTGTLWDRLQEALKDLLPLLYVVRTKSGGYHLYYRCEEVQGNQKLAMRHATTAELKETPHAKEIVLIETRGEGGYVLAPPSEGYTKEKEFNINVITLEQRDSILAICRSFNEVIKEARTTNVVVDNDNFNVSPWDDYNSKCDVIALLEKHGWTWVESRGERDFLKRPGKTDSHISADYHKGLGLFKVFSTSTEFETGRGYKPFAIYALLEHNNNFSAAAKQLIKDGYGEQKNKVSANIKKDFVNKKDEGVDNDNIAAFISQKHKLDINKAKQLVTELDNDNDVQLLTFWSVTKGVINIDRYKLINLLTAEGGFYLYYYDKKLNYQLVRVVDNFVSETNIEQVKKFLINYIDNIPYDNFDGVNKSKLRETIYKGADAYFNKALFEFMPSIDLKFLKHTKDSAYYPFLNGVVHVTKDKKELLKYGAINMHVWRDQVIEYKIDIDQDLDYENVQYTKFINKISDSNAEREAYAISLIGYLLHTYKDPTKSFAVILAEETEDEAEGGGAGKGLFFKAIGKLINVVSIDGKNFKLDKSFAFQRVELSTQLIVIEDCRKNVDFEGFYSKITEGVTIEKKNKDEIYIGYDDAPKFGFTTNYTINYTGGHGKRRVKVIEFSSFFNHKNTPLDFFGGKALFNDWDNDEWNRFYNYMIECVQIYLEAGIPALDNSATISRKNIKLNFGEDFLDYFDLLSKDTWLDFGAEYLNFLNTNDLEKKDFSKIKFKKGLKTSAEIFGGNFIILRNPQNNNKNEFKIVLESTGGF
jgi:hypothetical protein